MNEEEIKSIRDIMLEMTNINSTNSFRNSELSRRERIKERYAYLKSKLTHLTKEEMDDLNYCKFLVEEYYPKNSIV